MAFHKRKMVHETWGALTKEEYNVKSKRLVSVVSHVQDMEEQKKVLAAELSPQLKIAREEVRDLSRELTTNRKLHKVACEETFNLDNKTLEVVRVDNKKHLTSRERPLTDDEVEKHQDQLDLE